MFNFRLGLIVKIKCSGEEGEVIGRADYVTSEDHYLIRYKGADGRAVETWWGESAIDAKDA